MRLRATLLYTGITLCLVLIAGALWFTTREETLYTHVFKTETGYGYAIIDHGQILIRQEHIPAIEKEQSFCTETDAAHVGDLVLQKINRRLSPAVTKEELKELGVHFNCNL